MVSSTVDFWAVAEQVPDPELPMLTLADLGILRDLRTDGETVVVSITPTYTGCPALREMAADLIAHLRDAGAGAVEVRTVLAPPWTSDWITETGRRKLAEAGIAPPGPAPRGPIALTLDPTVRRLTCPRCGSRETRQLSRFGSTACKALYRCAACEEPFEYVKEI